MVAYLTRMPAGIPGEVNRGFHAIIEPAALTPLGVAGHPTAYGIPLVINSAAGQIGRMRMVAASGDVAASIYGLLARPFPTNNSQDPLGTSTPAPDGPCDVLRFGYMTVLLSGSAAAVKGSPVFFWPAAPSGTHITGGFEADNGGGTGLVIPGSSFMGPADANGNVEISVNFGA